MCYDTNQHAHRFEIQSFLWPGIFSCTCMAVQFFPIPTIYFTSWGVIAILFFFSEDLCGYIPGISIHSHVTKKQEQMYNIKETTNITRNADFRLSE